MRSLFLLAALTLGEGLCPAAPAPVGPPASRDPEKFRQAARQWAARVDHVADQLCRRYVRPLSRPALLEAMVAGLYRHARRPLPPDFAGQIRRACEKAKTTPGQPPELAGAREQLLVQLRLRLGEIEGLSERGALEVCCRAALGLLDPHSGLMTDADRRRSLGLEQESVGTGLVLTGDPLGPRIVEAVLLGSPAQRAGLRAGDRLTHLNGAPLAMAKPADLLALRTTSATTADLPLTPSNQQSAPRADGTPGLVRVGFLRPGDPQLHTAELLVGRFQTETVLGARRRTQGDWDYLADEKRGLAHVRLAALGKGTSEELRLVVEDLRRRKMRGLVLDLRWCPGGFLNEAVRAAELFLGEGTLATVKMRDRPDEVYRSTAGGKFDDFPVVVLVNEETSGGAELIAAALQDHRRAIVVGRRTLGKASVQTPVVAGEGLDLKLTTGTFVRPSGKNLHRAAGAGAADDWGIVPDEDFRVSPELSRRLKGWWADYSHRPAGARQRHPLDLPNTDPQQVEALRTLAGLCSAASRRYNPPGRVASRR